MTSSQGDWKDERSVDIAVTLYLVQSAESFSDILYSSRYFHHYPSALLIEESRKTDLEGKDR